MNASKNGTPATRVKPASGTGVEKAVPRDVKWSSVRDTQALVSMHRPPKVIKLPSGKVVKQ